MQKAIVIMVEGKSNGRKPSLRFDSLEIPPDRRFAPAGTGAEVREENPAGSRVFHRGRRKVALRIHDHCTQRVV